MSASNDKPASRKTQQALGVGLGISLVGLLALAWKYGFRWRQAAQLPESLSPAIFATRVQPTAHGQLVYHTSGSGNPLVFLHGIYPGASSFEWSRVYPQMAENHEVVAIDLIGFGESERPVPALDINAHTEALVEFFHLVTPGRQPVLVASGVSCKIVLLLASRHPELIKALLLWLPLGVRKTLRGKTAREAMGISRLPWLRSLAWKNYLSSPAFFERWISRFGFAEDEAQDAEVVSALSNCARLYQAEAAIWAFIHGSMVADLTPRLRDIRCPVTIWWPQNSPRHPATEAEALSRELPFARLHCIDADGLLAPLRHPNYFKTLLEEETPKILTA